MTTNIQVYNEMEKQVGTKWYDAIKYCGLSTGAPYCDASVTYAFYKAGGKSLYCKGTKQTYCPTSIKLCQQLYAQIPMYLAMKGDVIFFDWNNNNIPDHVGLVREAVSTSKINTLEGNTSGKVNGETIKGIVAYKERNAGDVQAIFRPHYKATYTIGELEVDGKCGYSTIANLQKAIGAGVDGILGRNTVIKLQKHVGVAQDGSWGRKTSLAVQSKICGFKGKNVDGAFGPASVKALQKWVNKMNAEKKTIKTNKGTVVTKPTTAPKASAPKTTLKSYKIDVDLTNQICTVYGVYSNGSTKALMSEFVSTARKGKSTPTGNFKIQGASGGRKAKLRTAKMSSGKSYAEYLCRFKGAKCMHGVPYKSRNTKGYVNKTEFNKLGKPASAGCVRMPIKLARYIYNNCPVGTPVRVFKGKAGSYPMGKPKKYVASKNVDPTK